MILNHRQPWLADSDITGTTDLKFYDVDALYSIPFYHNVQNTVFHINFAGNFTGNVKD